MMRRVLHFSIRRLIIFSLSAIVISSCDKLPNEVELLDIPSYYFDNNYLDNRVAAINNAIEQCSENSESFFWITDIHWEPELNTRNSPLLIKYIATKTGIDKILNGGDTGNSSVICKNAIAQLRKAIGSNKVYSVTGNHEINDASRYERPFLRVAEVLRGHNTDIVYGDEDKSFFYFDNENNRIRYIGLSTYGLYLNNQYESRYTEKQLKWFKSVALNVAQGWSIIVFTHNFYSLPQAENNLIIRPSGAGDFIDAIDDYKGNGTIVCALMGHTHKDRIHIGKSGVPYIVSACDRHATYHGDINVERIPGTISEQHFEVVVIDKVKREIKLFSIGANARDGYDGNTGEEVDVRIINY